MMTTIPIAKYDSAVPRYTSYPTAPHFHAGVDRHVYEWWLAELDPAQPLSLYLHIPFCDSLCWFCGCNTKVVNRYSPLAGYLDLLKAEMKLVAGILGRRSVSHVHFGGGTPSMLSPADIRGLGDLMWSLFDRAPGTEIAVEIDPRSLSFEAVRAFADIGVNRASIGVQDMNREVQEAVNRVQPLAVTAEAMAALRSVGVERINIDLMYGLPYQNVDRVLHTVECLLPLSPDRLAVFGYAHVPHMKPHQKLLPEAALPGRDARFAQQAAIADRLGEAGYRRIGLDHFARPQDPLVTALDAGRLRRNFQGYTVDPAVALIPLGASAIGALPQGYVQNAAAVPEYSKAIQEGRLPIVRGVAVTPDDRLRRAIIEQIMCNLHVDVGALEAEAGLYPDFSRERLALAALEADGLVEVKWPVIIVPESARFLLRSVAAVFDAYLASGVARHSRAV
ncbi:MAG: oxygen-independent coproporphyrinogen III oxidase [Alphaproteobacteria bacterium]|nr:oxygen-independent coproporphyrinogen III oxidase [Alphaproteobacteria bacterium]MBU0797506.1 oxygen-independent coproporphyrinogen III oxidase [Alphaproteobacteria bacterium]MBU0889065.1 oxygen-independent coproporphyrinogen III oxidase [Alphaproteobacteria bacterium]MBU1813249.1 oxygen-independent coproporphyrinogen III oxidase [Alphaproteobacteria bacterium]